MKKEKFKRVSYLEQQKNNTLDKYIKEVKEDEI